MSAHDTGISLVQRVVPLVQQAVQLHCGLRGRARSIAPAPQGPGCFFNEPLNLSTGSGDQSLLAAEPTPPQGLAALQNRKGAALLQENYET